MYDLIIIGGGVAGMTAAIYGVRAGLKTLVFEQNSMCGGQILNTDRVDNYPGLMGISGFELGEKLKDHCCKIGVEFIESQVREIQDKNEIKLVKTRKESFETRTVILAMGAVHSKLLVPGEDNYTGRGVSYCATCDGAFYKDKCVAVIGGGDTALTDAIYLSKLAKKVYLIHRRLTFRADKILVEKLRELSNVEFKMNYSVLEIKGDSKVTGICLKKNAGAVHQAFDAETKETEETEEIKLDGVFIAVGMTPLNGLIENIVELDERGYVKAFEDCGCSAPGFFVAGDLRTKKVRQLVTAVSDGANAVNSAIEYLKNQH